MEVSKQIKDLEVKEEEDQKTVVTDGVFTVCCCK